MRLIVSSKKEERNSEIEKMIIEQVEEQGVSCCIIEEDVPLIREVLGNMSTDVELPIILTSDNRYYCDDCLYSKRLEHLIEYEKYNGTYDLTEIC